MPGYSRTSESIFVDDADRIRFQRYHCPSCKYLLRDAVLPIASCGHWLCQSCAEELFQNAGGSPPRCPKEDCKEELTEEDGVHYFPDRFVRKEILNFKVVCFNKEKGCDWKGKFADYERHLSDCEFPCEHCQEQFHWEELQSHKVSCQGLFQFINHEAPLQSFNKLVSDELCMHTTAVRVESAQPIAQSSQAVAHNGTEMLNPEVCHAKQLPHQLPTSFDSQVMKTLAQHVATTLQPKMDVINSLQAQRVQLERMIETQNAEIEDRDFRLSLIENSNYDGSMVWKIPQFSQRMADAQNGKCTSIFSLPFYTGRYGYKMCLRLYILGDGIGKNTHMSLFFVIMRGEFDNILPWPFTYRVTLRLMNQTPGGRDIIDTLQPDPMSSSFRKPKNDMNIASGCPHFVSLHDLRNGGFIADDIIFIKCDVDTGRNGDAGDFRLSLIENSNYDGSMVWKIPQFSQRMADTQSGKYTSIFSLPFYTGRYGYKMCLRLYILGDGIGKNTHMSLFFVIMRGEFDNILLWPFTYRVTFRLMNQTPGGRDIIDTFQPDPMSSSFKKPKNDMNIASGCPRFISLHELNNGGFIIDDIVFVACKVDMSTVDT